jgi:hypothetical protein
MTRPPGRGLRRRQTPWRRRNQGVGGGGGSRSPLPPSAVRSAGRGAPGGGARPRYLGRVAGPRLASSEGDAAGWQLMNDPLGLRACCLTHPSRPDFPPGLLRKPPDSGRAPQACPARPGHPAKGGGPELGLPPWHPRHLREEPCRPTFASGRSSSDSWAATPRPEPEGLGGRLKRAREDEGLTERDLAHLLGLDSSTASATTKPRPTRTAASGWPVERVSSPSQFP